MKHGRYTARMLTLKRQARQEQRRLQGLALLARYGFESFEQVLDALQARGNGRHQD